MHILSVRFASCAFFSFVLIPVCLHTQQPAHTAASTQPLRFEVASIRESPADSRLRNRAVLSSEGPSIPGTLFSVNDFLVDYIRFAYDSIDGPSLKSLRDSMPAQLRDKIYQIEARTTVPPTREQLRQMVRTLLEERFHLKVHYTEQQQAVCFLQLNKTGELGPAIHPHPADQPCEQNISASKDVPESRICTSRFFPDNGRIHVKIVGDTLPHFASVLPGIIPHTGSDDPITSIQDRTGLQGLYDIDFLFGGHAYDSAAEDRHEEFLSSLKKQMGMVLVKGTAKTRILLVDHCEPPMDN